MFPLPRVEGILQDPSAVYGMMQVVLKRAECKEKLAVLIKEMKAEITEEKAKLKNT